MAESSSDESKVSRSIEGISKGVASMLSPSSRTDNNCGREPSELYGMHEWTITMFSLINKRELRSNTFEIGGYKWYLLIFPKGCDVSDHLSIFLCVDNHEKLPREWCHFAQFTIALVNKDPKKSKYSGSFFIFCCCYHLSITTIIL
ncbi:TNF receptor-associated factor homolog 1a-like [Helianthus annuus]|uniref:TNF receptor-associated factor homolog 1a-like n=1 Tax=Helianthus annuus TaxID=4232 RepID=UPI00165317F4|nr:TNF receptor-associated factor homolog 1a-like [Helianthus annuus]